MTDALDPRTQWIYQASRARTDSIELIPLTNQQLETAFQFLSVDQSGSLAVDEEKATSYLNNDPNPLAKYVFRNANAMPLRSVLRSVFRWGSVSALIEQPYLDLEFWDSHAGFYDKCFREHARHCERVHFFSIGALARLRPGEEVARQLRVREMTLLGKLSGLLLDGESYKAIEKEFEPDGGVQYIGYLVLRPTLSFSVGRVAIKFDDRSEREIAENLGVTIHEARERVATLPLEYEGRPFLKAFHACKANVLSTCLSLETMEFMQQDPNLGACATVSLWVASRVMSDKFGLNRFSYSTITRQAIGRVGPNLGSVIFDPTNLTDGLTPEEMSLALERTGARVLEFHPQEQASVKAQSMRLQQEVYSFIESGIPVILCLSQDPEVEGHAVVVVGHNLPDYRTIEKSNFVREVRQFIPDVAPNHYLVSSLIPVYYAHDDAYGPFNRITFYPDGGAASCGENGQDAGDVQCPCLAVQPQKHVCPFADETIEKPQYPVVKRGGSAAEDLQLVNVIVPVPSVVQSGSFERLNELLRHFDELVLPGLKSEFGENVRLLWRSLLLEGSEFKASTVRRDYSKELVRWYANMMLPKYVWLFEVSLIEEDSRWEEQFSPNQTRDILGEVIVDPTTPSLDFRCLAFRVRDLGYDYRRQIESESSGEPSATPKQFELDGFNLCYPCYRTTSPEQKGA